MQGVLSVIWVVITAVVTWLVMSVAAGFTSDFLLEKCGVPIHPSTRKPLPNATRTQKAAYSVIVVMQNIQWGLTIGSGLFFLWFMPATWLGAVGVVTLSTLCGLAGAWLTGFTASTSRENFLTMMGDLEEM